MDWMASIKPSNSNIPEYKDENYVFEEVQFMLCTLNENTLSVNSDKCISLFQKYIPYQIVLIVEDDNGFILNTCDKRINLNDKSKRTIERQISTPVISKLYKNEVTSSFLDSLDFITQETWPFIIDHTFTHQPGACNARNIALSKVTSEWVFMCDDDNRFEATLIEKVLANIKQYGVEVFSTAYPQVNERVDYTTIHQTTIFGSGNSFMKSSYLKQVQFDATYEFCYGEDFDFGMQLRKAGADVVYFPSPVITHLKAPMGGFRIKPVFKWSQDVIQPIPSPTILLNFLKYRTKEQVDAYKTIFYFKKWKNNVFQNPFVFLKETNLHWNSSKKWSEKI